MRRNNARSSHKDEIADDILKYISMHEHCILGWVPLMIAMNNKSEFLMDHGAAPWRRYIIIWINDSLFTVAYVRRAVCDVNAFILYFYLGNGRFCPLPLALLHWKFGNGTNDKNLEE